MAFPNKYSGDCVVCGQHVPEGEGLVHDPDGEWRTVCSTAQCLEEEGLEAPTREIRRDDETDNLVVDTPYEEGNLSLVRSFPGARFDGDRKLWMVSADPADRPRVLEVAEKLALDIEDGLRDYDQDDRVERLLEAAKEKGAFDYQLEGIEFLAAQDRALLADDMGLGKAQPLDAGVLTPSGWSEMGDIEAGDQVIGSDGCPTSVEEVFPQGEKTIYRVTFSDGSSTECCGEHLWDVTTPTRKRRGSGYKTMTLDDIRDSGIRDGAGNRKYFVPMVDPVKLPESDLDLHPWVMGVLLGDGSLSQNTPSIANPNDQIIERLHSLTPDAVRLSEVTQTGDRCQQFRLVSGEQFDANPLTSTLNKYGVMGCTSPEKFVPKTYMMGSVEQRRQLLAGLLDTDGSCYDDTTIEFSSSSQQLAQDVQQLVQSLGGTARMAIREAPAYKHHGKSRQGRDAYRVTITMPNGVNPFWCDRKAKKLNRQGKYGPTRAIESIEEVGEKTAQCIRVSASNSRYVTDDHIVTHNTMQTILALPEDAAVVVTCPNSVKYVWRDEVAKWRGDDFDVFVPDTDEVRPPEPGEIVVVNYNRLPGTIEDGWDKDDYDNHGVDLDDAWYEMADAEEFVLIGDEIHAFKNRKAQRTRRFKQLNELADRAWGLSGTPLPNRPMDLWGTLSSLDIAFKVFDFWNRFIDLFGGYKNRYGGYEFGTPDEEAAERLRRVMVKRDKEEVLDDLPSKTIQTVTVNGLPDELEREMDGLAAEYGDVLEGGSLHSFEEFSTARRRLAEARIPHAIEMVEEYEEAEEPLVVFSDHRAPVEEIGGREGWEAIHGGVNDEVRADRIEAFQNGRLKGLALTIGAGKEGITLTRASTMLFIDLSWVPGDNLQAMDRIRRIGQEDDNCHYIRLVSPHALDQHILNLLSWKMELIDKGVDGEVEGGEPEGFDFEVTEVDDEVWEERVEAHVEEMEREQMRQQERDEVAEVFNWMLNRCDGAQTEDYQGFNGWDAQKARRLAPKIPHSDGAAEYAKQMLRKYRGTQWGSRFDVDWYDEENGEAA